MSSRHEQRPLPSADQLNLLKRRYPLLKSVLAVTNPSMLNSDVTLNVAQFKQARDEENTKIQDRWGEN